MIYKTDFDLTVMFPKDNDMIPVNTILAKCIVQEETQCLKNAGLLLQEVDRIINIINKNAYLNEKDIKRICKVCGIGNYKIIANEDQDDMLKLGICPQGGRKYKVFNCSHCGHIQFFYTLNEKVPELWKCL